MATPPQAPVEKLMRKDRSADFRRFSQIFTEKLDCGFSESVFICENLRINPSGS
jgi:hypothetical protein